MLNHEFKKEMDRIFALVQAKLQNLLFSATLSTDVQVVESVLLSDPTVIKVEVEQESIELINQVGYFVAP